MVGRNAAGVCCSLVKTISATAKYVTGLPLMASSRESSTGDSLAEVGRCQL
jgi:hypothetical protein